MEQPPITVIFNGEELAPKQWASVALAENDTVTVAPRPFGFDPISLLVIALVSVAAALVVTALMPTPKQPQALNKPQASPTYSYESQSNRARLMNPIPWACGRNRHWPDLLTQPYYEYEGNEQFVYQLFSVGWGAFKLEELHIGDTPAKNFKEIEYEFYGPDDLVTLFPDNVVTSPDVVDIEIVDKTPFIWHGPYVTSQPRSEANYLAVDIHLPQGLYHANDNGGLDNQTTGVEVQYQAIDDDGDPFGRWYQLGIGNDGQAGIYRWTMATNTPQRFTVKQKVDAGRYHVRLRRAVHYNDRNSRLVDKTVWIGLRAYLPSKQQYEGVTKFAVKIQASNNLSSTSENKFNLVATALKPIFNGSSWGNPVATKSIAWAYADAIRSEHGGRLPDGFINTENLLAMHKIWEQRGDKFSMVFDTRGSLLDTLKTILACGRATPVMSNGQLLIIRDQPASVRRHLYSPANMTGDGVTVERQYRKPLDTDSVIVEYTDTTTWKPEEVLCQLPGQSANNIERVKMTGIQDRAQAFREGCFLSAKKLFRNVQVKFSTELDALNSDFGDTVGVAWEIPGWGQSGSIIAMDGMTLTTSEPVVFSAGQHYVNLRRADGSAAGPYRVLPGNSDYELVLQQTPDFRIYTGTEMARTIYQFGTADTLCKNCVVTNISPSSDKVRLTAFIDNLKVHSFDKLKIPTVDLPSDSLIRPVLPAIKSFVVVQSAEVKTDLILSWLPEPGARSFVVDQSADGVNWFRLATPVYNTMTANNIPAGLHYFRVAAIGGGQGGWSDVFSIEAGKWALPPESITDLVLAEQFTGAMLRLRWITSEKADNYRVEVLAGGVVSQTVKTVHEEALIDTSEANYDLSDLTVRVYAVNTVGESGGVELAIPYAESKPDAVTGLVVTEPFTGKLLRLSWTGSARADGYRVEVLASGANIRTIDTSVTSAVIDLSQYAGDMSALAVKVTAFNAAGTSSGVEIVVDYVKPEPK